MYNYEHKKLKEAITNLDEIPSPHHAFSDWIEANSHLEFLRDNAKADELIIYVSSGYSFVHSVVVQNDRLSPIDQNDLMGWGLNPCNSIASYVMGGGRDDVWVERGLRGTGSKTLEDALQLIFGRTFEGWVGTGRNYFELHQEYAHLSGIHWLPERRAYCRFNERGDLDPVVSITTREEKGSNISLVTFKWEPLEEYLVASESSLVRMFDFTLFRKSGFNGWPNESPQKYYDSDLFFYHQLVVPNNASYTRGIQIIRSRRSKDAVFVDLSDGWIGKKKQRICRVYCL